MLAVFIANRKLCNSCECTKKRRKIISLVSLSYARVKPLWQLIPDWESLRSSSSWPIITLSWRLNRGEEWHTRCVPFLLRCLLCLALVSICCAAFFFENLRHLIFVSLKESDFSMAACLRAPEFSYLSKYSDDLATLSLFQTWSSFTSVRFLQCSDSISVLLANTSLKMILRFYVDIFISLWLETTSSWNSSTLNEL